jgi:hypothetical protein
MAQAYHQNLRSLDLVGRMQLIANQRHWLLSRAAQCRVSDRRLGGAKPNPAQVACLKTRYNSRIGELRAWPQPQARKVAGGKFHPLTAYVEYRVVDGRDAAVCTDFAKRFNDAIGAIGGVDFTRMNGFTQITGSHGPFATPSVTSNGHRYEVNLYDAGPYASYQMRAYGLNVDGQAVVNDISVGSWIATLPNGGGRFSDTSSQTRDYSSIDVFRAGQRNYALVNETWGYYSAAAQGESSYAALYDVSDGGAQQRCLFQTYLTPPIANVFGNLPAFKELVAALDLMAGDMVANLAQDERRDEGLLQKETEWILLNMPLVPLTDAERYGRTGALRQRHDAALDAIFAWSERNVPSKLQYRRLLPLMQPARDELVRMYQQIQGLKPDEAGAAADLLLIDVIDRAAESLGDYAATAAAPLAPFANYNPRYAAAPAPGDLERGRKLTTLHSAALNRQPAATIADFLKYEAAAPMRSVGPAGDTALMAAVRTPETVKQLLDAGFAVNATNDWKKTALMTAAQTDQFASAQILLDAGADPRRSTSCWHVDGAGALDNAEGAVAKRTALMYAAAGAGDPMLRLLLERGAEANARDAAGRSACDYLGDNKLLTDAQRAAVKGTLCTAGTMSYAQASPVQTCPTGTTRTVSAEEAKQLGGPVLTLFGAERAGNDEGTIPEYSGAGVQAPPGWNPDKPGVRPDPYAEKPLFTITAQNAAQYADRLDGMSEVFKKYPDFRMDIYPTHRDFVFPQYVLDNTAKNANSCKGANNELKLEGCYGGIPFPVPETGKQAMWNHLTAYTSRASIGKGAGYIVPVSGAPILVGMTRIIQDFRFYDPAATKPHPSGANFWRALYELEEPARWAGTKLMLLDPLDQMGVGNSTYFYVPGLGRRAKLSPSLSYDTPVPWTGDTQNMDDIKVFNGALDRYDFKLIGKKEKYIYYDGFRMTDPKVCPASVVLTKHFPNPSCVRWELHRVWVVEAALKNGARHAFPKRIFYWDEDGFSAGQAENYSADGILRRIVIGTSYPYFEAPGGEAIATFSLDLKTGMWSAEGIACPDCGSKPLPILPDERIFSPEAMAAGAVR